MSGVPCWRRSLSPGGKGGCHPRPRAGRGGAPFARGAGRSFLPTLPGRVTGIERSGPGRRSFLPTLPGRVTGIERSGPGRRSFLATLPGRVPVLERAAPRWGPPQPPPAPPPTRPPHHCRSLLHQGGETLGPHLFQDLRQPRLDELSRQGVRLQLEGGGHQLHQGLHGALESPLRAAAVQGEAGAHGGVVAAVGDGDQRSGGGQEGLPGALGELQGHHKQAGAGLDQAVLGACSQVQGLLQGAAGGLELAGA